MEPEGLRGRATIGKEGLNLARNFHEIRDIVAEADRNRAVIPSVVAAAIAALPPFLIVGLDGLAPFVLLLFGPWLLCFFRFCCSRSFLVALRLVAAASASALRSCLALVLGRQGTQITVQPFDILTDQLLDRIQIFGVGFGDDGESLA